MDELSIQRGGSTGYVPQGHNGGNATAAPGGFSVSFTDLLQQAGAPVGIGFDALPDLAGNTTDPDPAEPPAPGAATITPTPAGIPPTPISATTGS